MRKQKKEYIDSNKKHLSQQNQQLQIDFQNQNNQLQTHYDVKKLVPNQKTEEKKYSHMKDHQLKTNQFTEKLYICEESISQDANKQKMTQIEQNNMVRYFSQQNRSKKAIDLDIQKEDNNKYQIDCRRSLDQIQENILFILVDQQKITQSSDEEEQEFFIYSKQLIKGPCKQHQNSYRYQVQVYHSKLPRLKRSNIEGYIQFSNSTSLKSIKQDIIADILKKRSDFDRKCFKKQFRMKNKFQCESNGQYVVRGELQLTILQLPIGYEHYPSFFNNFICPSLTIYNRFGSIKWSNVDLLSIQQNIQITIGDNFIKCNVQSLNRQCQVQFYNLPFIVDKFKESKDKCIQMLKRNCLQQKLGLFDFIDIDIQAERWSFKLKKINH